MKKLTFIACILVSFISYAVIVLEDAEDGTTDGWVNHSATGCNFTNIIEPDSSNRVISFSGGNACRLGGHWFGSPASLHQANQPLVMSWRMRTTDQPFNFYISVTTNDPNNPYKTFNYASASYNHGLHHFTPNYIHHGLAQDHDVSMWRTFTRDLTRDMHDALPDVEVLEIHGIIIGNHDGGYLDDVVIYTPEETIYEDGENGIANWHVVDTSPPEANISVVADSYGTGVQGNVIKFDDGGNGLKLLNAFEIGAQNGEGAWNNTTQRMIQWRFREFGRTPVHPIASFEIDDAQALEFGVHVQTTNGYRYLYYTLGSNDTAGSYHDGVSAHLGLVGNSIHHAIGDDRTIGSTIDEPSIEDIYENPLGLWQAELRDLQQDIDDFESGNKIISVNGFVVKNTGLVDDIEMLSRVDESYATTYEDADDGITNGWWAYDETPVGATINNVFDVDKNSNVIELSGSGVDNGYEIGRRPTNPDQGAAKWDDTYHKSVRWDSKFNESFNIYVSLTTTIGDRFMRYRSIDADLGIDGNYIDIGLGLSAMNNTWHTFDRNVQADFSRYYSGETVMAINSFLVRGSGRVDNIQTFTPINIFKDDFE